MDFSTGGWLIMSQPNGLLILWDHFFKLHFFGQRGLINTAGLVNPNLTLFVLCWFQPILICQIHPRYIYIYINKLCLLTIYLFCRFNFILLLRRKSQLFFFYIVLYIYIICTSLFLWRIVTILVGRINLNHINDLYRLNHHVVGRLVLFLKRPWSFQKVKICSQNPWLCHLCKCHVLLINIKSQFKCNVPWEHVLFCWLIVNFSSLQVSVPTRDIWNHNLRG